MSETFFHRIMVRTSEGVGEAERCLREHGIEPFRGGFDVVGGTAIDFSGPRDLNLDFLRPDILPPRQEP